VEKPLTVMRRSEIIVVQAVVKTEKTGRKLLTFDNYLQFSGRL